MSWLWSLISAAMPAILGLFGYAPKKNQSDIDRAAGEESGRAKQNAEDAKKELVDANKSVEAGRAAGNADDDGGVRDVHPGDRKWNGDSLG